METWLRVSGFCSSEQNLIFPCIYKVQYIWASKQVYCFVYHFEAFAISQTKFENTEGWEARILENIEDENEFDWRRLNRSIVNTELPIYNVCSWKAGNWICSKWNRFDSQEQKLTTHTQPRQHVQFGPKCFTRWWRKRSEKMLEKQFFWDQRTIKVDLFSPKLVYINRLMDSNAIKSIEPTEWNKR